MSVGRPRASGSPNDVAPLGLLRRLGRTVLVVLEQADISTDEMQDARISALEREVKALREQVDASTRASERQAAQEGPVEP